MVRVTKVHAELFEFIYASQFHVSLPCVQFRPIVEDVDIRMVDATRSRFKDAYPQLSFFWLRTAREQIAQGQKRTITQVSGGVSCARRLDASIRLIDHSTSWGLLVVVFSDPVTTEASCCQISGFDRAGISECRLHGKLQG